MEHALPTLEPNSQLGAVVEDGLAYFKVQLAMFILILSDSPIYFNLKLYNAIDFHVLIVNNQGEISGKMFISNSDWVVG